MSRNRSLYDDLRQPRVMMMICCIAVWMKFEMILSPKRDPTA
jgi:hypothetical protein